MELFTNLCRKCFINTHHPNKKDIEKIVLSEEKCKCDKCGRMSFVVDYVED